MNEHDGRVALVTGAARGIGRALAERLAAAGASVIAMDLVAPRWAADSDRVVALAGHPPTTVQTTLCAGSTLTT